MKNKCFNALAGAILGVTLGLGCSVQGAAQGDFLSAREWFQDLHRFGRRRRVHAPMDREGVWRSP